MQAVQWLTLAVDGEAILAFDDCFQHLRTSLARMPPATINQARAYTSSSQRRETWIL